MPLELSKPDATRAGAKAMRTSFTIPGGLMLGRLDCVTGDTVAITADRATVAQWRQARAEAIYRDDMWGLQVFKAATVFLEEAERYGLADDDVLLQRLAEKGHATALRLVNGDDDHHKRTGDDDEPPTH
jgi:hypothetical protein